MTCGKQKETEHICQNKHGTKVFHYGLQWLVIGKETAKLSSSHITGDKKKNVLNLWFLKLSSHPLQSELNRTVKCKVKGGFTKSLLFGQHINSRSN